MKIAIYRGPETAGNPEQIVLAMLRAMVRREPATPLVARIPGGAAGAWIEDRDGASEVVAADADGSFAIGDPLLLKPGSARALLDAVRAQGDRALEALDGAFAAIVHLAPSGRTSIITDRFSTRPVYVFDGGNGLFAAASEAKALFAVPGIEPKEDPLAIYDLLNFGYLIGERTWFAGVSLVPETTAVVLEPGKAATRTRWRGRLFEPGTLSEKEGLDAVADAFEKGTRALGKHAMFPAVLLSGGLDSRTISSFCGKVGLRATCYTFGPKGSAESEPAIGIARANGFPVERHETQADLIPKRGALAEWICDGHVSLSDIHFLDHHIDRFGPRHGGFFDGWLGGVIGGAYYVKTEDLALKTKDELAASMKGFFDYAHPVPLEDKLYAPAFAKKLRERAGESIREFLSDWEIPQGSFGVAREAASLRFRDRRWQLFHNGVVAEPFNRGLKPYCLGEIVDKFQALPLESRMYAKFYQKLILKHFPSVAAVPWQKTGRPIGAPASPLIDNYRKYRAKAFYYLGRASNGRLNLRDKTRYSHYDSQFRESEQLRSFISLALESGPERPHVSSAGLATVLDAERRGGRYFEMIGRLLQAELTRRLFFDPDREAVRRALLPEKIGAVRLYGQDNAEPVRIEEYVRTTFAQAA